MVCHLPETNDLCIDNIEVTMERWRTNQKVNPMEKWTGTSYCGNKGFWYKVDVRHIIVLESISSWTQELGCAGQDGNRYHLYTCDDVDKKMCGRKMLLSLPRHKPVYAVMYVVLFI